MKVQKVHLPQPIQNLGKAISVSAQAHLDTRAKGRTTTCIEFHLGGGGGRVPPPRIANIHSLCVYVKALSFITSKAV